MHAIIDFRFHHHYHHHQRTATTTKKFITIFFREVRVQFYAQIKKKLREKITLKIEAEVAVEAVK